MKSYITCDVIQATIFGDDVQHYDKVFHQHKENEIPNAPLRLMKEELCTRPDELEMYFNTNTIVHPLFHLDDDGNNLPNYCDLSFIDPVP